MKAIYFNIIKWKKINLHISELIVFRVLIVSLTLPITFKTKPISCASFDYHADSLSLSSSSSSRWNVKGTLIFPLSIFYHFRIDVDIPRKANSKASQQWVIANTVHCSPGRVAWERQTLWQTLMSSLNWYHLPASIGVGIWA